MISRFAFPLRYILVGHLPVTAYFGRLTSSVRKCAAYVAPNMQCRPMLKLCKWCIERGHKEERIICKYAKMEDCRLNQIV